MSHPLPSLNRDILSAVVEHAETETLLSLMLCCRALYQDSVRLQSRYVSTMSLAFSTRSHLRGQRALLVEGIKQAPIIDYLELTNADLLLSTHPDLCAALASLENVKHLKISYAAEHTCLLLESAQWLLVTAGFERLECEDDFNVRMHPAAMLGGAVKSLTLIAHWVDGCGRTLDEWAKAYPNVSQLTIHELMGGMEDQAACRVEREGNLRAHARQCWPRLGDASFGCVSDLYTLGIPCHIRAIQFFRTTTSRDLRFFPETMEHARPVHSELCLSAKCLATFQTALQQAANGLRDLEQLHLAIDFYNESIDDSPRSLLQGVNAISLLPKLLTLTLEIRCYYLENLPPRDSSPSSASELSLITFDLQKFCRALFSLAPPMETVGLQISGALPEGMSPINELVQRTEVIDA
ncbi:hypothetical protein C8Q74DRAFT_1374063 [Fomes fomentarius]|nr:hypothetical protein C8Q74DRAFT_1374063 [Fomes fomentarius]